MPELRAAFYGDDFTGSVDALLQFTRAGWRGRLFVGRPDRAALIRAAADAEVIGIAGIARSLAVEAIDAEVRPALTDLRALRPRIVQYKACSTADSSPAVGSIGRVLEIAREVFGDPTVPILFAQPDFGRYTAFGHHFAAEGGTVYRLDRQPTMSSHPVTPMTESDLARHLSRQTDLAVGALHLTAYDDDRAVTRALRTRPDAGTVLDAINDGHITLVGRAVAALHVGEPLFAIGSGGLSTALASALSGTPGAPTATASVGVGVGTAGPVLAVSGSRSPQTGRQLRHAVAHGWVPFDLSLDDAIDDTAASVVAELAEGRSVVVSSAGISIDGERGEPLEHIAGRLAAVVRAALAAGVTRRTVVCGGDTSSRVVSLLGAESLQIAANPVGNVVVCRITAPTAWLDGSELLLKGGQVGPVDLLESVRLLGGSVV